MEFISKKQRQYKANLHCHSTYSDGKMGPTQLVQAYKEHGYSVLAITDHESTYDHTAYTTDDFVVLTGYEAYIRPSSTCVFDYYAPEIHLNLFAKDPHNLSIIAYDPPYCKYMPRELAESRPQASGIGPRKYSVEYINAFIDLARKAGYLVAYNHPNWSMESDENILNYEGIFSLEIFNTQAMIENQNEYNLALYDKLLRNGKLMFCHGADDNHNKVPMDSIQNDSFKSWTMIMAKDCTYESVIHALEHGDFYASTGPEIYELKFEKGHVHLECSPAQVIHMQLSPKKSLRVFNHDGSPVTAADFEIPQSAPYVYFSVISPDGTSAHTRAFRREEFEK